MMILQSLPVPDKGEETAGSVGCSENEAILAARSALLEVQHCFRQLPDCGDVSTLP